MDEKSILEIIENTTSSSKDIKVRKLTLCEINIYILYLIQITDRNLITDNIIKPLLSYTGKDGIDAVKIANSIIYSDDISLEDNKGCILDSILEGNTIILIPGDNNYIKVNTFKVEKRSVDSPQIETAIRSPKDSFTENLDSNLSLIRYRIKDSSLTIEHFSIGRRTKTDVALVYLKDVANVDLVDSIRKRLSDIEVDGLLESGHLQKLILGSSPLFPEIGISERSDSSCGHILDGRVCIMINGSNLSLIAPKTLIEFLDSGEDHYDHTYVSVFVKFLRILAIALTLTLSPMYITVVAFHPDFLPSQYVLSLASSRVAVPVNAFLETLIMEALGELLREGSIRLPKQIGPAISIVGTIVIGQAVVSAGLVSPLVVIIVALSSMTSFASPDYGFMNPIRLLKYMLIFLTGAFGFFGLLMGITIIVIRISSTTSFGVPYTAPISPFNLMDVKKFFFTDINFQRERASYLNTRDKKRK